jgi:hypothetical protein
LSRFISRLGLKGLPLYQLLKKHERFSWTVEAQEALNKLKVTLAHTPILTPPRGDEPMYLYIAATTQVVSAVIVVERTPSTTPSMARANRTRAAAATTTGTKAVAATTTRVPIASASQTTLSRLSSALRRGTRRRPPAASKTC